MRSTVATTRHSPNTWARSKRSRRPVSSHVETPSPTAPRLRRNGPAATPPTDAAAQQKLADAVRRFTAADRDAMLDADGPNWYRGAALCNEASESDVLKPLLGGQGVKRLVIGHTPARNLRVASRFDGVVIKLDAGMNSAVFHGHPAALLLEQGEPRVVYADGKEPPAAVPTEPLYVTSPVTDDATVAAILADGNVTPGATRAPAILDVVVERDGLRVPAVFIEANTDAASKELAAYGLDRALRLGLVPATVKREVQGKRGTSRRGLRNGSIRRGVEAQSLRFDGGVRLPQFDDVRLRRADRQ
jgi:hypothetical protein